MESYKNKDFSAKVGHRMAHADWLTDTVTLVISIFDTWYCWSNSVCAIKVLQFSTQPNYQLWKRNKMREMLFEINKSFCQQNRKISLAKIYKANKNI